MKIAYRDIKGFAHNPPPHLAVILVYGPDYGLMKERVELIAKKTVPDITDPFNVSDLDLDTLDNPSQILDEANTISMMGDKRLVRVRSGSDKLTATLKDYLKNPNQEALILIEAEALSPRSTLRKLCESDKKAAALPCYVEEMQDLSGLITSMLRDHHYTIEREAQTWLADNLSGDHQRAKSEIEKLMLYKGKEDGTQITLRDAMYSSGQAGVQSMDDLVYAVGDRDIKSALKTLEILLQDGIPEIGILRGLQNHFRKLLYVRSLIDSGCSPVEALSALKPPLFFKIKDRFGAQVRRWSTPHIHTCLATLSEIEGHAKSTGYHPETLIGHFITQLQMEKTG